MKRKLSILILISLILTTFVGCVGLNKKKIIYLVPGKLEQKEEYKLANQAIQRAESELDVQTKIIEMGDDESTWDDILKENSKQKGTIIISCGDKMAKIMNANGLNYKQNKYINFDTIEEVSIGNGYYMHFKTNEAGFLAGITAMLVTKSQMDNINDEKKIGFIGLDDNSIINDYLVGYIKGAEFIVQEGKVDISYIGEDTNKDKNQEVAKAMLDDKVDIIYSVANEANKDIIDKVTDNQKYIITEVEPIILEDNILAYCKKNIDTVLYDVVKSTINKELEYGQNKELGIKEKGVDFIFNKKSNVPEEVLQKLESVKQKIKDDEISIKSAFGMDEKTLNQFKSLLY